MREYLKSIRTREENLDELKRRRKAVSSKADAAEKKLSKMSSEHKNLHLQTDSLNVLRAEIRSLDSEIMSEEASLGDFKRTTTRQWMGLKFGALLECSENFTRPCLRCLIFVLDCGRVRKTGHGCMSSNDSSQCVCVVDHIIQERPEETTQPGMARRLYYGHTQTQALVSEAYRCINEIQLSTTLAPGPAPARPSYPPNSNTTQLYQGEGGPSTPTSMGPAP